MYFLRRNIPAPSQEITPPKVPGKAFSPAQISRPSLYMCHKPVPKLQPLKDTGVELEQSPLQTSAVPPRRSVNPGHKGFFLGPAVCLRVGRGGLLSGWTLLESLLGEEETCVCPGPVLLFINSMHTYASLTQLNSAGASLSGRPVPSSLPLHANAPSSAVLGSRVQPTLAWLPPQQEEGCVLAKMAVEPSESISVGGGGSEKNKQPRCNNVVLRGEEEHCHGTWDSVKTVSTAVTCHRFIPSGSRGKCYCVHFLDLFPETKAQGQK